MVKERWCLQEYVPSRRLAGLSVKLCSCRRLAVIPQGISSNYMKVIRRDRRLRMKTVKVELWRQCRWRTDYLPASAVKSGDADYLHSASWSLIEATRRQLCLLQSLLLLRALFLFSPNNTALAFHPHAATRNLDVSIALGRASSPSHTSPITSPHKAHTVSQFCIPRGPN